MSSERKLVLVVVDSLHPDNLDRAISSGAAPTFAALVERGTLVRDCVSSFPSVTPVCTSEIQTGVGPDQHWIPGMNWYHRTEERYVEYGSSFEATRAFGVFRSLYDTVYNLNMGHLSPEVETIFERLGDAGLRTACTPFLLYRGRTRHELGLDGLLRGVAVAAGFTHAVWGPDELFYGELYASRIVPCRPTLARPGTRDEYSACVGRELEKAGLYDFLLFSLPDHDYYSHKLGPDNALDSISAADNALGELIEAGGGLDNFLDEHALLLVSDHAQTAVTEPLPLAEILAADWRVLAPNSESDEGAEIAVGPTARAGGVYILLEGRRYKRAHERIRERLLGSAGVDLVTWIEGEEAVVANGESELRFAPGSHHVDRRGEGWATEGDLGVLELAGRDGRITSEAYPDALGRLWRALRGPNAADVVVSLDEGWECVDWGGATHVIGGSHGSLLAGDSLCPLLMVGWPDDVAERREQWTLRDVHGLAAEHFEVGVPEAVA
ncbi:MAG: alkaline phosphatase family protein [Solirubrobacterales bacterium]